MEVDGLIYGGWIGLRRSAVTVFYILGKDDGTVVEQ
jgi:hypothetical protein